jgi:glycerate 2-kinase
MNLLTAAQSIYSKALTRSNAYTCVLKNLELNDNALVLKVKNKRFPLSAFKRILLVGAGKAGAAMVCAAEELVKKTTLPYEGVISIKYGHTKPRPSITLIEAGHPLPDDNGVHAAQQILSLCTQAEENDLIISLISGGGSSLLVSPVSGISLADKIAATKKLLACGAAIDEINAVRKHISKVKGGGLAKAAAPATVINLLLSDVLYDRMDVIASGPFVPDQSTYQDALDVLRKYNIEEQLPQSVTSHLKAGAAAHIPETPKQGDPAFKRVYSLIIGSNSLLLKAAQHEAEKLGFNTLLLSSFIQGEARELGKFLASIAHEIKTKGRPVPPPACILMGGETTVTVHGKGKGGRSQECALQAAIHIAGLSHMLIYCAGSDGTDGPTDAAGAWCSGKTVPQGKKMGVDADNYLKRNDSYHYFDKLGSLIKTGPTGTNLLDLYMILVGKD